MATADSAIEEALTVWPVDNDIEFVESCNLSENADEPAEL